MNYMVSKPEGPGKLADFDKSETQLVHPSIVTRSVQPEPSAVAIVRQNGRSSASCRASVAVTPVSRQI